MSQQQPVPQVRSARQQLLVAVAVGVVAGIALGVVARPAFSLLGAFTVAAFVYDARVHWHIAAMDGPATQAHAGREDPTRGATFLILSGAAIASLAAIGVVISQSQSTHGARHDAQVALSIAAVAVSWTLVHTVYALAYARLYYAEGGSGGGHHGGVDFPGVELPAYPDFLYLAFTIGMTFQVSDTPFTQPGLRRLALRHALTSYLFGAVILAVMVNLVASLV